MSSQYISSSQLIFCNQLTSLQVKLGPQIAVVLSSARAIKEVLDKQSGITSDRPSVHINTIVTHDNDVVFARYSECILLSSPFS